MKHLHHRALPVLLATLLGSGGALAETVNCTQISTLPATISPSGVYCLKTDLTTAITSGAAITIAANVVTIDLNCFRLGGGLAGPASQAVGIRAVDKRNITLKNGQVRGFLIGIDLQDTTGSASSGHVVEGIRWCERATGATPSPTRLWRDTAACVPQPERRAGARMGDSLLKIRPANLKIIRTNLKLRRIHLKIGHPDLKIGSVDLKIRRSDQEYCTTDL